MEKAIACRGGVKNDWVKKHTRLFFEKKNIFVEAC
jgi:hypothetical protein